MRKSRRILRILVLIAAIGLAGAVGGSTARSANVTYTYDALGRVVTALYDTNVCIAYTYDLNGNRTSQTINAGGTGKTTWGCFSWGSANWMQGP